MLQTVLQFLSFAVPSVCVNRKSADFCLIAENGTNCKIVFKLCSILHFEEMQVQTTKDKHLFVRPLGLFAYDLEGDKCLVKFSLYKIF
jgi:hypothetical protein